jgi:hypothetical protein
VENGALTVTAIRITEESPHSEPLTGQGLKEAAPQYSGEPEPEKGSRLYKRQQKLVIGPTT